jgi:Arc/MetJ-type ribon-helix-helix transcriptional regulator
MSITIKLAPELEARVRASLDESTTLSEFVRSALIEKLERSDKRTTPHAAWRKHLAACQGLPSPAPADVNSENLSEKIRERLIAKHRTR